MSDFENIPREKLIEFLEGIKDSNVKMFMRDLDRFLNYGEPTDNEVLEHYDWCMDCQSPLELSHSEGSFASGWAATMVIHSLREDYKLEMLRGEQ